MAPSSYTSRRASPSTCAKRPTLPTTLRSEPPRSSEVSKRDGWSTRPPGAQRSTGVLDPAVAQPRDLGGGPTDLASTSVEGGCRTARLVVGRVSGVPRRRVRQRVADDAVLVREVRLGRA